MLLEYHKIYREEGIVAPPSVREFKRQYFVDADKVGVWLRATVREHEDMDYKDAFGMGLASLYGTFTNAGNWVTKKQFKADVIATLGTRDPRNHEETRGVYICRGYAFLQGYTLITEMDEEDGVDED
jgi:hypothetical protein